MTYFFLCAKCEFTCKSEIPCARCIRAPLDSNTGLMASNITINKYINSIGLSPDDVQGGGEIMKNEGRQRRYNAFFCNHPIYLI